MNTPEVLAALYGSDVHGIVANRVRRLYSKAQSSCPVTSNNTSQQPISFREIYTKFIGDLGVSLGKAPANNFLEPALLGAKRKKTSVKSCHAVGRVWASLKSSDAIQAKDIKLEGDCHRATDAP